VLLDLAAQVLFHDLVQHAVEGGPVPGGLAAVGGRHPARQELRHRTAAQHRLHGEQDRGLEFGGVRPQVDAEEHLAEHAHGQRHHAVGHVDRLAAVGGGLPPGDEVVGALGDGGRLRHQQRLVEERLADLPALAPLRAVGGEHPAAEEQVEVAVELAPHVVLRVVLQDVLDRGRIADQVHHERAERDADDPAVLLSHRRDETDGVAVEAAQLAAGRSGRDHVVIHRGCSPSWTVTPAPPRR
jgi:hypothetical protein